LQFWHSTQNHAGIFSKARNIRRSPIVNDSSDFAAVIR
jgi:hypothetical protein